MDAHRVLGVAAFGLGILAGCSQAPCTYPEGAHTPMTHGAIIPDYAWPEAMDAQRNSAPFQLADAHCAGSQAQPLLLFVSSPAW